MSAPAAPCASAGARPRVYRPIVLCYHAVTDAWEHPLAVSPSRFERQVRSFLARGYRPVGWRECLAGDGRLLHVTFDDAYASVPDAAAILDRLGVPCTVFACTGLADTGAPMDLPAADTAGVPPEALATLDWAALAALSATGVEIGSHTVTHPRLTTLEPAALADELITSRRRLEVELKRPCDVFAYPFGDEDARVRGAVRAAGYAAAFAMPGRVWDPDVVAIPRVGIIRRDGVARASIKASRLMSPLRAARARAGARRAAA